MTRPCLSRHAAVLALTVLLAASPARAAPLEKELLRHAPQLIKQLQEKGFKTVGVLKFLVAEGGSRLNDRAGPLNHALAQRLEIALALANPVDAAKQIGIIRDASARAATLPGASHLTAEGRKVLFEAKYPLAWGTLEVTPDAFLTGTARFSADLRTLTVTVEAFDRSSPPKQLLSLTADAAPGELAASGASYLLRELVLEPTKAAAEVKAGKATFPLLDATAPVMLEVLYDGKPVKFEVKGGEARVAEPKEGQEVVLVVRRRGPAKERLALVLKVNGQNTLFRQDWPDFFCSKWVLEPGRDRVEVRGYFLDGKKQVAFRVLSQRESKIKGIDYGKEVGLISLTVYRERRGERPEEVPTPDEVDAAAVARTFVPEKAPKNPFALKAQLRQSAERGLRALIGEGQVLPGSLRHVEFVAAPVPLMTATVRYYRP